MNLNEVIFFAVFLLFIFIMLAIDLGLLNKQSHVIKFKEALSWSMLWIGISIAFYFVIKFKGEWIHGVTSIQDLQALVAQYQHPIKINPNNYEESLQIYRNNLSLEYISGYIIEKTLSVDNIFVMIMIFSVFGVQEKYYHHVLSWGIIGAIIMRFLFIFLAAVLIQEFTWVLYIFGGILIFTGVKMFFAKGAEEEKIDPHHHPVVRFVSKYFAVFPRNIKRKFVVKDHGKLYFTPLLLVLLVIEFSDVIFAVDSIPAIFAITKDPYIVFFSNIFAILGLRALFFILINVLNTFHYLKYGLAILLTFIGVKMLAHHYLEAMGFTTIDSLIVIVSILGMSIIASLLFPKDDGDKATVA